MSALYQILIKSDDFKSSEDVTDFLSDIAFVASWVSGDEGDDLRAFEFPGLENSHVGNLRTSGQAAYDFVITERVALYRDDEQTRNAVVVLASAIAEWHEVSVFYDGQSVGRTTGKGAISWADPMPPYKRDRTRSSDASSSQSNGGLGIERPHARRFHSDQPSARARLEDGSPANVITYRILLEDARNSFDLVEKLVYSTLDGMVLDRDNNSIQLAIAHLTANYREDVPADVASYFRNCDARLDVFVPEFVDDWGSSEVVRQIARNLSRIFDVTVLYDHEWMVGSFRNSPDSVRFLAYELLSGSETEGEPPAESEPVAAAALSLNAFRPVPGAELLDWEFSLDDRRDRINLISIKFKNAQFQNWIYSLMPNPGERALVQDVSFIDCYFGTNVHIGGALFIDCTFENVRGQFQTTAAVFHNTVLRGTFDEVRILPTPSYSDPYVRRAWLRANINFYRTTSLALDLREATFRQCPDLSGVPSHLIAWENTPSVSVHQHKLTQEKIDAFDFEVTPWKASLENVLKEERDEILFAPLLHEQAESFVRVLDNLVAQGLATASPKTSGAATK